MKDLAKARQARRDSAERRKAGGLKATRTPLEKVAEDPASRTKAIAAKCYDCVGGDTDPCWPWRVGNCDIHDCGLHSVRPHKRREGTPMPRSLVAAGWGEPEQPGETEEQSHAEVDPTASAEREANHDGVMQTLPGL